jgi:hypothetical protein|tara:strand:+ start:2751 stop:3542 length:792 start_codon:yes stop_codon:yes gene_type:complete
MAKFFVILLATVLATTSCVYYKNVFNPAVIEKAVKSLAIVDTKAILEIDGEVVEKVMRGTAFYLGDGYVLALTHTTKFLEFEMVASPFGYYPVTRKIIAEKWLIDGEEIELIGRHKDISLFLSNSKKKFPLPFGDSTKARIGTEVVVLGWSFGKATNIKNGIISRTHIKDEYGDIAEDCFLITVPTNSGDSGSPMIALRNNGLGFEILGVVNAGIKDKGMGFAIKSNFVLKAIEKIKKIANKRRSINNHILLPLTLYLIIMCG